MTLLLKQLFGFFKLLHSENGTNQIAWGIGMGFILGMTPALSLQSFLVFVCLFLFRIQIGAAFLAAFFFKFCAFLLDGVFDSFGTMVLETEALEALFTTLYNMPLIPLTRFNNSIVMGSGIVAIILLPIVVWFSKFLIIRYRESVVEKFKETKVFKAWKATALYQWYYKYDTYFGE
jgi:uncharacterized protein (TIGR03546 family)